MSREVQRAPVSRAQDPLQLNLTSPEGWTVPDNAADENLSNALPDLAARGAWQVIARETSGQQEGVASLEEASWHILAQYKLRDYPAAQEALVQLAGHDPAAHASLSSSSDSKGGSSVPFALRLLSCDLLVKLSRWKEGHDAYYRLLDLCRIKVEVSQDTAHADLWRQRLERVAASLFVLHLRVKDFKAALHWILWLLERHPQDIHLLSTAGCVQLDIGHTQAALTTFQEVVTIVSGMPDASPTEQQLVRRNKGILLFAQNNFAGALQEFQSVAASVPQDAVAANNRAICEMYAGHLTEAVQSLEGSLQAEPAAIMHEITLRNLGNMYDLFSPMAGQTSKRALAAWAACSAPQDMNLSYLE